MVATSSERLFPQPAQRGHVAPSGDVWQRARAGSSALAGAAAVGGELRGDKGFRAEHRAVGEVPQAATQDIR